MKAMIFAAGKGERLKPLTNTIPKALVPIHNKPMLQHIIEKLKKEGFHEIVINVHHLGEQIIDFINSNNQFGINIQISDERDFLLDTGGAIKKAANLLNDNEPFLVHNTDILSNADLNAFYKHHCNSGSLASLLVSRRMTSRYLLFDNKNALCGWHNRTTGEIKSFYPNFNPNNYNEFAFSGIHIIDPKIFKLLEDWTGKFSIIDFYIAQCAKHHIDAVSLNGLKMLDIGNQETLQKAEDFYTELSNSGWSTAVPK